MKKIKKIVMSIAVLLIVFCLSFLASYFLIIKPQYQYITKEKVYEEIKDLKEQISDREEKIVMLEQELEIYRKASEDQNTDIKLDN